MSMLIRAVKRTDYDQWKQLWQAYRLFYKAPASAEVTETTWNRFFDGIEPVNAFVAEKNDHIVGLVHYIFHRSTWFVEPTCYLQDLFTVEAMRGAGIGRALIQAVYEQAKANNAARVYWLTHETNETAQSLYDQIAEKSGFIQYRKNL
jgi:GNAT superfamily N-acetyltransferase